MHKLTPVALALAVLALAGCGNGRLPDNRSKDDPGNRIVNEFPPPPPGQTGPQEPQYGPEQAMAGTWTNRFEHSDFNGCWLDMTEAAAADLRRLDPENTGMPLQDHSWRVRIIGQRQLAPETGPALYGHMGGWRCAIRATRFLSVELLGESRQPAPPEADRTPVDPEFERARKAAGADRPAFSAGHDRARLEDQRRAGPPGPR
jgi:hypothetical protein